MFQHSFVDWAASGEKPEASAESVVSVSCITSYVSAIFDDLQELNLPGGHTPASPPFPLFITRLLILPHPIHTFCAPQTSTASLVQPCLGPGVCCYSRPTPKRGPDAFRQSIHFWSICVTKTSYDSVFIVFFADGANEYKWAYLLSEHIQGQQNYINMSTGIVGYTGWSKKWHSLFCTLNFIKYWPIFKLISLPESGEHLYLVEMSVS